MTSEDQQRVVATEAALAFLAEIQRDQPEILFHQSGGCCDGSSPMCYPASDYRVGETEVFAVDDGPFGSFDVPAVRAFIRIFAPRRGEIVVDAESLDLRAPRSPAADPARPKAPRRRTRSPNRPVTPAEAPAAGPVASETGLPETMTRVDPPADPTVAEP